MFELLTGRSSPEPPPDEPKAEAPPEKVALAVTSNLSDGNFWVRYSAAAAIASSEEVSFSFGDQLAVLLTQDENRLVRHEAAKAMCILGERASAFVKSLVTALEDSEMLVRRDAAKALYGVGSAVAPHAAALADKLHDPFWPVRWWTARTMENLGKASAPHAWVLVIVAVHDTEQCVRETAARSLGGIGGAAAHHMETLCKMIVDGSTTTERHRAADAMAHALGDPDEKVRNAVCKGLDPVFEEAQKTLQPTEEERLKFEDPKTAAAAEFIAMKKIQSALTDEEWLMRRRGVEMLSLFVRNHRPKLSHRGSGSSHNKASGEAGRSHS